MAAERILCAAIWVDDGKVYDHQSVPHGLLFCGWRHSQCIEVLVAAGYEGHRASRVQGFLTSTGRFVDRAAAGVLAYAAGQTAQLFERLTSEDLY